MPRKKSMYQRPDGLFEKKITLNGKRITFRARTEIEVFRKIANYQEAKANGPTFAEVAKAWYAVQEQRFEDGKLSFNTLKGYHPAMREAINYFDGQYAKDLQPQQCNHYAKYLAGRYEGEKTVANKLSVMHCILDFACVEYNLTYNPADKVKVPDGLHRGFRDLPPAKHIKIVQTKRPEPGTDAFTGWLFCYVALNTGARRGEIIPMRMGWNIDLANQIIHIRGASYFNGNTPMEKSTKSLKGVRNVVMLNDFKATMEQLGLKHGDLLFSWQGGMITSKRLEMCLKRYYAWAGIDSTPHQYRHGFITVCFEAGIDPKVIQEMAGHAQLSTTLDIYTHLRRHMLDEAAKKLNKIDFSTGKIEPDEDKATLSEKQQDGTA